MEPLRIPNSMAGRQTMRIDFEKPHAGVVPHIHLFIYPERGNTVEYIFDLQWHLINLKMRRYIL